MRAILLSSSLALLSACAEAPAALDPVPPLPRVRVATVSEADGGPTVVLHGVTRADHQAPAAFPVGGRVAALRVDAGDRVSAGAVLATLDAAPFRHRHEALSRQREATVAQLDQLRRDVLRLDALAEERAVSVQAPEQLRASATALEASLRAIEAQLDEAAWALDHAVLRAPYDAVVLSRLTDVGGVVAAGAPVVALRSHGGPTLQVELPERHLAQVRVGQQVDVTFPLANLTPRTGTLVAVGEAAERAGLFPVRVDLPADPDLRPGLTATVSLRLPAPTDGLEVPLSSIVSPSGQSPRVQRVREGLVDEVPVAVRFVDAQAAVVYGALASGDEVVVAGHVGLSVGDRVEVSR